MKKTTTAEYTAQMRLEILNTALNIESLLSGFLYFLTDAQTPNGGYSFGATGDALSFKNKVNLLIDIAALKKEVKDDMLTFMEIRNQIVHNRAINNYETLFISLPNRIKKILKFSELRGINDSNGFDKELQLKSGVDILRIRVIDITAEVSEKLFESQTKKCKGVFNTILFNTLKEIIDNHRDTLFERVSDDLSENIGVKTKEQIKEYLKDEILRFTELLIKNSFSSYKKSQAYAKKNKLRELRSLRKKYSSD